MAGQQLTLTSPLMQPVSHNGQLYFTSQYFHQQYLANSPHRGKYAHHHHFLKVLRAIEAYESYVQNRDIIELSWQQVKSSRNPILVSTLEPLFVDRGYQKLYLLNATAQVALSHHLDDEISKEMSVAANTFVAKQAARRSADLIPDELATRKLSARLDAAKLLGAPLHIAQQEAVKAVLTDTGVDFRPLLRAAPAQDAIAAADKMLEPTDLARELGWGENKGATMNKALGQLGWQVKKIGGGWEATPAGKQHCADHAWTSGQGAKSGYNLKWRLDDVRQALGV